MELEPMGMDPKPMCFLSHHTVAHPIPTTKPKASGHGWTRSIDFLKHWEGHRVLTGQGPHQGSRASGLSL